MAELFQEVCHPKQKEVEGMLFPLILEPTRACRSGFNDLADAIKAKHAWLLDKLKNVGAIIFRGFKVENAAEFNELVTALGYTDFGYEGGAATRRQVIGAVYSNDLPSEIEIGFHNEMAYLPRYPDVIMFFCKTAPRHCGTTPIVRGSIVYDMLKLKVPQLLHALESKGITYYSVLDEYGENSWRSTFATNIRSEAEQRAKSEQRRLVWLPDGGANAMYGPCKAIDYVDGRHVWLNSICASSPKIPSLANMELGDGTMLPNELVQSAKKVMNEACVSVEWKDGDIMILDNMMVLHSREPSKPPRCVLVALCKKMDNLALSA